MRLSLLTSLFLFSFLFLSTNGFSKDAYVIKAMTLKPQATLIMKTDTTLDKLPTFFTHSYSVITGFIKKMGLHAKPTPFSRYHKYAPPQVEVEAGFLLSTATAGEGEIIAGTIPGGEYAMLTHIGPYEKLGPAYEALHNWMKANKKLESGAPYELYIDAPGVAPVEKLRTEIYYPFR